MTRSLLVLLFGAGALSLAGCVERKITIGSGPPGALVFLNDVEIGRTPITVPFTWYGDYDIRMRLDQTEVAATGPAGAASQRAIKHYYLHTHERAKAPWFQWIGLDLIAEVLPIPFKDQKIWAFDIPEVKQPPDDELIRRAEGLKSQLDVAPELGPDRKNPRSGPTTRPK